MSSSLENLEAAIGKVEDDIKEVKDEIKRLELPIEQATQKAEDAAQNGNDKMFKYWCDEKNKLRDKENKLRDEKLELQKQRGQLAQTLAPPPPGEPQVNVHRLSMRLWNSRQFPGVRREVYQILAQGAACYPTNREDGVRYDGKTLCIQAFTRSPSDAWKAAGAISVVIQQRVSRFPGQIRIDQNVVEPSEAASTCWHTIMATDYSPDADEECSPQETVSDSGASAPDEQLSQYQSFEHGAPRFRVKAHLISKERLKHSPLSKLNKDRNNFLALTATAHDLFDGRNVAGGEAIAIRYEGVTQDQQPKVTLRVIPVDDDAARFLASSLRDFKATTDPPRGYLVHVHASDPALFRVCITWKYNKTVKGWADRGCAPEGAVRVADYGFGLIAQRIGGDHDLDEE